MKIISPLFIDLPRKTKKDKRIYLNLNVYRNLFYIINNQAKEKYNEEMRNQLENIKLQTPITINFVLYKKSKRRTDRSNILSIVEKFFCDSLVHFNCIPDDNDDFIKSTHYYGDSVDKENPRVEIFINE